MSKNQILKVLHPYRGKISETLTFLLRLTIQKFWPKMLLSYHHVFSVTSSPSLNIGHIDGSSPGKCSRLWSQYLEYLEPAGGTVTNSTGNYNLEPNPREPGELKWQSRQEQGPAYHLCLKMAAVLTRAGHLP